MKILIATDKFKGSLSAKHASEAVKSGLNRSGKSVQIVSLPMADGGDGLLEALKEYSVWKERTVIVADPLFREIKAGYLISEDNIGFIEMAQASGLLLLFEKERNPLNTSTYGTGELIRDAVGQGVRKIILGIGGSATNDAGIGMAAALGYKFLDKAGNELIPVGENLAHIHRIDTTAAICLEGIEFEFACDVDNPLTGITGAARVYAPQKGATAKMVDLLEFGLVNFASVVKKEFNLDIETIPGGGAAGGLGAGGLVFLNAKLKPGIDLVLEISNAESQVRDCDLVITGEGKLDEQSLHGKVISGIAGLCRKHQKPLIVLCGRSELSAEQRSTLGISKVYSISDFASGFDDAVNKAAYWLEEISLRILNDFSKR